MGIGLTFFSSPCAESRVVVAGGGIIDMFLFLHGGDFSFTSVLLRDYMWCICLRYLNLAKVLYCDLLYCQFSRACVSLFFPHAKGSSSRLVIVLLAVRRFW